MAKQIRQLLRAQASDGRFRLAEIDPDSTPGLKQPKRLVKDMAADHVKLFTLQDEIHVLPGHGKPTTIGRERPHLDEWIKRGW